MLKNARIVPKTQPTLTQNKFDLTDINLKIYDSPYNFPRLQLLETKIHQKLRPKTLHF